MDALFRQIPAGVGTRRPVPLRRQGTAAAAGRRLPLPENPRAGHRRRSRAHRGRRLPRRRPARRVSPRAIERGGDQCGTLGSGNHFLEVQVVDEVLDEPAARVMGLQKDAVCVMIHSGLARAGLPGVRRRPEDAPQRARPSTASTCPTGNWPAPRCTAPRGRSTWGRCGRRPISPGPIGNCSCSRPARSSPSSSAALGKRCK